MGTKLIPGQLFVSRDAAQVAQQAAIQIARVLREGTNGERGAVTIALSGGNTPREAYALLAHEPTIDWTRVHVFWVDERAVPPTDDRSNFRWAKATLLDAVGLDPARVHRMPAERPDHDVAAREYETVVRAYVASEGHGADGPGTSNVPAFDVMILGIGDDGHTASLFPGEPTVDVHDRWIATVPARGAQEARMTMTSPLLQAARHAFVLAVGRTKNAALERVWDVQGDVHETPARVLRDCHGALTWLIDSAAAGLAPPAT